MTFTVEGGTWTGETATTITRVYVLGTKNPNNTWAQDLNKTLGNTIPTGQPTDNTYEPKGENEGWSPAKPMSDTLVTAQAEYTLTYVKPDHDKQSITIGIEGNTINFYYTKRTDLSYTVNYLRADTDEVLAEAKEVENQTFKAVVTENAIPVEGYASDAESKNCEIKVDGNVITFVYTPIDYAITYNLGGGTVSGNPASYTIETETFTLVNPTRSGYTFAGWTGTGLTGASGAVTIAKGSLGERTYTATWTVNEFVFPFTPTPTPTPTPSPAPAPTPAPGGTTITDDETPLGGAVGLNETEHFAYVNGYEDGTVRPTARITRAEVATIFFRLMTEEYRIANWSTGNSFTDADPAAWYNIAISTAAKAGILKGYADGSVKPGNNITHAEFAAIAARFLGDDVTDDGVGDFTDTANHWAAKEIRLAAKAGWITGGGNKFNPDAYITRAEVMIIINRMLDCVPNAEQMLPGMKTWSDNPAGTWYYADVQEATVDHHHERGEDSASEIWTELTEKKDWDALQEEWAANNGASAPKADPAPAASDGESK